MACVAAVVLTSVAPAAAADGSAETCPAANDTTKSLLGWRMWWHAPIGSNVDQPSFALQLEPRARVAAVLVAPQPTTKPAPLTAVLVSNIPEFTLPLPEAEELPDGAISAPSSHVSTKTPWAPADDVISSRVLKLRSWAAVVVDQQEGRLLFSKNSDAIRAIASITKLMTAMVVLDSGAPLDERLIISSTDVDTLKGSTSHLPVGTILTRRDLLKLALMSSENRAAAALARSHPSGRAAFVEAMNRKAAALSMRDTQFLDPTGLNPANRSTAYDLALMVNAGYQYPLIREFTTSTSDRFALSSARFRRFMAFHNSNKLMWNSDWEIGLSKTGYISEAGRCLVLQAKIAARSVIIVLLDSFGNFSRTADANRIKRWIEDLETTASSRRRM
jgi:D-alanyl-D-alanine endopeptidase (penicillin-binding protein 7)